MLDNKIIGRAKEIRKQAAQKWACTEQEIYWPACISMAMKGETIMSEESKELFRVEKKVGLVVVRMRPDGKIEVGMLGGWYVAFLEENKLMLGSKKPAWQGKPVDGVSLTAEQIEIVKAALNEQERKKTAKAEAVKVERVVVTESTLSGWSVSPKESFENQNFRSDFAKFSEILKKAKKLTKLSEKFNAYRVDTDLGDYVITTTYEMSYVEIEKFCTELSLLVEADEKTKAEQATKEKTERQKEISRLTLEEIARRYFTESLILNECGEYVNDPNDPDATCCYPVWKKDAPEAVRQRAASVAAHGKHKSYTYRLADEASCRLFAEKFTAVLEAKRQELLK